MSGLKRGVVDELEDEGELRLHSRSEAGLQVEAEGGHNTANRFASGSPCIHMSCQKEVEQPDTTVTLIMAW
jgi:hypothetical protein